MRWRYGPAASRTFLLGVTVASVSTLLCLLVAEFVIRVAFRDVTTTPDVSYFTLQWRARNPPMMNRFGFRERDFSTQPEDGVLRIAVIGDSFTYGQGLPAHERLTNILERQLNQHSGRFEVLNFGRRGTETVHHIRFLEHTVLATAPDFVLLQ